MNLLIVTVGGSPMPIYLTIRYLLDKDRNDHDELPTPDIIVPIFSSSTKEQYSNIKKLINNHHSNQSISFKEIDLANNFRDHDYIVDRVLKELEALEKNDKLSHLHINYTGGTKPMAVAVASAILQYESNRKIQTIYSDFDPKRYRLNRRDGTSYPANQSLKNIHYLSIDDLYSLHGLECKDQKNSVDALANYKELLPALLQDAEQGEALMTAWDSWPNASTRKRCRKEAKQETGDADKRLEKIYSDLFEKMPDGFSLPPFSREGFDNSFCDKMKELRRFITGQWLEEYLVATLENLKEACDISELKWNVEGVIVREGSNYMERDFEIDIIALQGTQPFVFTCTTDTSAPTCKSKAFEGVYRARQLGGNETKTILVCCAKPETVEKTLTDLSTFDIKNNFYILGIDDIIVQEELKKRLKEIFKEKG